MGSSNFKCGFRGMPGKVPHRLFERTLLCSRGAQPLSDCCRLLDRSLSRGFELARPRLGRGAALALAAELLLDGTQGRASRLLRLADLGLRSSEQLSRSNQLLTGAARVCLGDGKLVAKPTDLAVRRRTRLSGRLRSLLSRCSVGARLVSLLATDCVLLGSKLVGLRDLDLGSGELLLACLELSLQATAFSDGLVDPRKERAALGLKGLQLSTLH